MAANISALAEQIVMAAKHGLTPSAIDDRIVQQHPDLVVDDLAAAWEAAGELLRQEAAELRRRRVKASDPI